MEGSQEEPKRSGSSVPEAVNRGEEREEDTNPEGEERSPSSGKRDSFAIAVGRNPRPNSNGGGNGDVSLREWLDKPERPVERPECLHVFRQVAEMVSAAHDQGVVVSNIRPSCFVLSSFNQVSFIESASSSTSGSGSDSFKEGNSGGRCKVVEEEREGEEGSEERKKEFPMKQMLVREINWYTSPEEVVGKPCSFASDVYRLGVLLFELFCKFKSMEEKLRDMLNLRHRVLPPQLLLKWPKEASFCLWLLHPRPNNRPNMSEVLKNEFLSEPWDNFEDHETVMKLSKEIEYQELLLDFLVQLQQKKQDSADKLQDTIFCLSSDLEEVLKQKLILKKDDAFLDFDKEEQSPEINEDSASFGSRKRFRQSLQSYKKEEHLAEGSRSDQQSNKKPSMLSKSSRLMKNIKKLDLVYFQTRCQTTMLAGEVRSRNLSVNSVGQGSIAIAEGNSVDNFANNEAQIEKNSDRISPFLEGLCKYLTFSKLKVRANLNHGDFSSPSNLVCSVGFDRDKELFATAGVNRKIKIFECDMMLNEDCDIHYPVAEMSCRSRLSSICWNGYIKSQIASSDFEGVVQVWDITKNQVFVELHEHERRIWSVDFSLNDPRKLASGSDDGSVKLWNINQVGSIGTIKAKANVCSVQFPPDSSHSLAIGSADHRIYYYDLRKVKEPLCTLVGHTNTVSYVKFVDSSTLVTASTDNSLNLWDLSMRKSCVLDNPLRTFTGHTNMKNFVGLSVSDGYIATGSETNEVFVYHKAFPMPMLSFKFSNSDPVSGCENDDTTQFISCVCWRGRSSILVAVNSSGSIKLLEMV